MPRTRSQQRRMRMLRQLLNHDSPFATRQRCPAGCQFNDVLKRFCIPSPTIHGFTVDCPTCQGTGVVADPRRLSQR